MPRIDFTFRGYINGARISTVEDANGKKIDVRSMSAAVLAKKLNKGELFISLGAYLYESDTEIILADFTPHPSKD